MKKIFTLSFLSLCATISAQTFSMYKLNNVGVVTQTITNGGNVSEVTAISGVTNTKIKIKNNAATTQTFSVLRTVVYNNPSFFLDNSASTPNTYFCFGYTCFGSGTSSPSSADFTILAASGQTSTSFPQSDNSTDNGQPFSVYVEEGSTLGDYIVKYKVFNVANANDTLSFTITYNNPVGIKTHASNNEKISAVYPNPASNYATISLTSEISQAATLLVYNSLGMLVKTSKVNLMNGNNNVTFSTEDLASGVYNVIINTGKLSQTKKLTVSR